MTTLPLYACSIEAVASRTPPPNWVPLLLLVLGVLLVAAALPLHASKTAVWTLIASGGVTICVSVVMFIVYARKTEDILAARETLLQRREKAKVVKAAVAQGNGNDLSFTSLAETAGMSPSPSSFPSLTPSISASLIPSLSPSPSMDVETAWDVTKTAATQKLTRRRRGRLANSATGVSWMDDNKPTGSPLSAVKEFRTEDPTTALQSEQVAFVPDHAPKPVPATPSALRFGYEAPYSNTETSREYEAATYTAGAVNPEISLMETAPMFYTPPSQYPTVDDIATERQRFWCRPETPETDRVRREGGLQEAAFLLGPPKDRSMVAVTSAS